eukprot:UN34748
MGALVSLFKKSEMANFEPDFENDKTKKQDEKLYTDCEKNLKIATVMLDTLQKYKTGERAIKTAIEDPDMESQSFEEILPNIKSLKQFYDFSQTLGELISQILVRLSDDENEYILSLEALSKQYAAIISFTLQWDSQKMLKSNIQNDLAFYRRCMDRQSSEFKSLPVSHDHTAYISMFLAEALPFLSIISSKLKTDVNKGNTKILPTIGKFANAAAYLISKKKFPEKSPYYLLCLRAMVGSLIIFDRIDNAFKSKLINVQKIV